MKLSLPAAFNPARLKDALGKIKAKLPLRGGSRAAAQSRAEDDSFSTLEDNTVDPASFAETEASIPAGRAEAEARNPLESVKSLARRILANKAVLVGIIAGFIFVLLLIAVGVIVSEAPKPLPEDSATAPAGEEAVKGLIPPLNLSAELEPHIELEREKDGVYTVGEADELLSSIRAQGAGLNSGNLAAHNDDAAAKLYNSVP